MTATIFVGLAFAGAVGAASRYLLDRHVEDHTRESVLPWGTFVVNMTGSLLLGLLTGAALYHAFPDTPKIWLGTGFCGAYTTFSTFTFETVRLLEEGAMTEAFISSVASLLVGTAAAAAGLALMAAL